MSKSKSILVQVTGTLTGKQTFTNSGFLILSGSNPVNNDEVQLQLYIRFDGNPSYFEALEFGSSVKAEGYLFANGKILKVLVKDFWKVEYD